MQLAATICLAASGAAGADAASERGVSVRALAEVQVLKVVQGHEVVKLVPADLLAPGDEVIYTVEIRNTGAAALPPPRVDFPIPRHARYVEDTAAGPGAEVTFSIDGGTTFDRPENLQVKGSDGQLHRAGAADYTHIRWQLRHILKGNAVAYAHFRAIVS